MTRAGDLALLHALIARRDDLRDGEAEAFESMLDCLADERGTYQTLREKQRKWAKDAADRLEIEDPEDDPAKRNAHVPIGRDVPRPAVLQHLPKAPPGRKARA